MGKFKKIEEAILTPVRVKKNGHPGSLIGGLYDKDKNFIDDSTFFRDGKRFVYPLSLDGRIISSQIDCPVIFGGYLYNHFGHFLLESLSRLHVCDIFPDYPIVWIKEREMKSWHRDLMSVINIKNDQIFVSEISQAMEIIVPDCGFSIGKFFKGYHQEFLGKYENNVRRGTKLWLSRSFLSNGLGGVDNEPEIEYYLKDKGWTIFHSQLHSIDEQIDALSSAERIAGFEGSAFHLLILIKNVAARVDIFTRGNIINNNFNLIADAKGFDQRVHFLEMEKISGERSHSRYRLNDVASVIQMLDR
ncbi:glycosyltransferase 61 family protein [Sphingobium sp.]|uniref:glycosyltransferase 61 family protein n=1 Tax=Sphingobium sp. TaxID=1912891 RepID=UPI002B925D90|nr:glycosyltransferase 61 family protein [Sphingobium sp.]HUD91006.1 glycosyltransferase 61 family protein [Sphingobium sp.]